MKRRRPGLCTAFVLAAFLPVWLSRAQEAYPTGPDAGRDLAATLTSMRPVEDTDWRGVMKISGRNHKTISVPVTCQTVASGGPTWTVTYTAGATNGQGAEKLEIIFSTNAPPQYLYARAASATEAPGDMKALTGAAADVPFGGSDFWLSDLGFEFYHWPDQNRLKGEMERGKPCFVLESTDPHPAPVGYGRVKVWVEKESGAPMEADAYGADGRWLKKFELGSVEKVNGRWELKDLEIHNEQTGSRTRLVFDLNAK